MLSQGSESEGERHRLNNCGKTKIFSHQKCFKIEAPDAIRPYTGKTGQSQRGWEHYLLKSMLTLTSVKQWRRVREREGGTHIQRPPKEGILVRNEDQCE